MKIRPIRDRVLIKLDHMEDNFGASGVVRPDVAKSRSLWGDVVAVGVGHTIRKAGRGFETVETGLLVGDRVCVPWRTGHDVTIGNMDCVMVRANDIIAKAD